LGGGKSERRLVTESRRSFFTHWERREVDRVAAVMMVSGEASGEGVTSFVMVVWVVDYPSAQREVEWMVVVLMAGCGARQGDFLCGVGLGCWAVNSFVLSVPSLAEWCGCSAVIMHDGGRNTAENAGWRSFGFDDDDAFFMRPLC
jgi:hypothetical protein